MNVLKKQALAVSFAGAIAASAMFIAPEEGISLVAYQDSVKVWTVCRGHTGPDVKKNLVYTNAMCDSLFKSDIWIAMKGVIKNLKVEVPEPVLVSFTSFVFNVGEGKFRTSTMLRKANAGDLSGACKEFPRWKYAGGMDCSVRANNCWGVWERRSREQTMCESGLK